MTLWELLSKAPAEVVIGALLILALLLLLLPLSLRVAGLTGQQIADTISLTLQFFINLVREYRGQNKGN